MLFLVGNKNIGHNTLPYPICFSLTYNDRMKIFIYIYIYIYKYIYSYLEDIWRLIDYIDTFFENK